MKDVGLVLAPEVVEWDVSLLSGGTERLRLLQRRACFTELAATELAAHSAIFGPIALSFDIAKLRGAGATPVLYVPQGIGESALSRIGTVCVRGAFHTQYVLRQLQGLKEMSDPAATAERFGMPVAPDYKLILRNPDAAGNIVAESEVPSSHVKNVLQYVGFKNIPFDHSMGVLSVLLNMFYPTDNMHTGDQLGYYRQREWRLIAGDINFNGRPMGRSLSDVETIPIVFAGAVDPVGLGLAASMQRPGGNVTGVAGSFDALEDKRLQLLHELVPAAIRVGYLANPENLNPALRPERLVAARQTLGVEIITLKASHLEELESALAAGKQAGIGALLVPDDPFFINERRLLVRLVARHSVPAMYSKRFFVEEGGLIGFGAPLADQFYQAGIYVARILKGAHPADLPIIQPTKFELVINLKTARTLGLTIPQAIVARADEVIE
jgi:hypothetical protein